MSDFLDLVDLCAERIGGAVLHANDDFFAPKENLLKPGAAVFREHEYTDRGKWMDGWESRRRRTPGNDFALVRLGLPGILRGHGRCLLCFHLHSSPSSHRRTPPVRPHVPSAP